jgi:hypothetical protein
MAPVVLTLATLAALAWIAGFVWFVRDAMRPASLPFQADGIVALTGGADRIATAIQLLQQNRGRLLLISGVGRGTEFGALFHGTGIAPGTLAGRITLGRTATDTLGNADEAAEWARAHGLHSLIVVTASYHMRRALTEIGRTLPDARLFAAPVLPPALRGAAGFSTLRLLAGEYTKFLAAECGMTLLQRGRGLAVPQTIQGQTSVGHTSLGQTRPRQTELGQIGTGQIGAGQIVSGQVGSGQIGTGESGTGESGTGEISVGQIGRGWTGVESRG